MGYEKPKRGRFVTVREDVHGNPIDKNGHPIVRDEKGRFIKGYVANPAGNRIGGKHMITELRRNTELALRKYLDGPANRERAMEALDRVFDIARNGKDKEALAAVKLIEKMMLNSAPSRDSAKKDDGEKKRPIAIQIINQTKDFATSPVSVIEGEIDD